MLSVGDDAEERPSTAGSSPQVRKAEPDALESSQTSTQASLTRVDVHDAVRKELQRFAQEMLRGELNEMARFLRKGLQDDCRKMYGIQPPSAGPVPPLQVGAAPLPIGPGPPLLPTTPLKSTADSGLTFADKPVPPVLPGVPEEQDRRSDRSPQETDRLPEENDKIIAYSSVDRMRSDRSKVERPTDCPRAKVTGLKSHREKSAESKPRLVPQKSSRKSLASVASSRTLRQLSLVVVNHTVFDVLVAVIILLNGVLVGCQTDYVSRNQTNEPPVVLQVLEVVFGILFTIELSIRLFAFRIKFFTEPGVRGWNIFDLVVVDAGLVEMVVDAATTRRGGLSFNLLRTLRLVRVIRLVRTLRLIGELRTIVSSIASSMKPLFWTSVLLFGILYVLGVYVCQVVHHEQMTLLDNGYPLPDDLQKFWGDLVKSVFTLFQSIAGGLDWDDASRPLVENIGWHMGVLYTLYISFTVLAMLNVVTGVFIESVMEHGQMEIKERQKYNVHELFRALDVKSRGEITWEDFEQQLGRKEMLAFFKAIDVDISNAANLFELLDVDRSGSVDADEFVDGCLKIWAPAQGLDKLMILRDVNQLKIEILENLSPASQTSRCSLRKCSDEEFSCSG